MNGQLVTKTSTSELVTPFKVDSVTNPCACHTTDRPAAHLRGVNTTAPARRLLCRNRRVHIANLCIYPAVMNRTAVRSSLHSSLTIHHRAMSCTRSFLSISRTYPRPAPSRRGHRGRRSIGRRTGSSSHCGTISRHCSCSRCRMGSGGDSGLGAGPHRDRCERQ